MKNEEQGTGYMLVYVASLLYAFLLPSAIFFFLFFRKLHTFIMICEALGIEDKELGTKQNHRPYTYI